MANDMDVAFPVLTTDQVGDLRTRGRCRSVDIGDLLWTEGDRGFGFFVVLSGRIEVVENSHGTVRPVTVHGPGEFTGDVDLLTGRASLVTGRVIEAGEVLELDATALQRVVGELPELSEILLKAFLTRRALLLDGGFAGIRIIGSRFSPEAHQLREFASRNAIPFTWIDLEKDEQAEHLLRQFGVTAAQTPIVIGRDGHWVSNPPVSRLARYAGLEAAVEPGTEYDLIAVGAGPAGLAASVYAASEGLRVLTLDSVAGGGQAGTSSRIENYLGFPTGISGADLARNALLQAQKFGARISVPRTAASLRCERGVRVVRLDDGSEVAGRCILVASGVEYRSLAVPGLKRFESAGVYYAASDMESRLCQGEEVAVVGGGNSAGQAAMHLSRSAKRVHIILRGEDLGKSMSRYLVDRVEGTPNITVHRQCVVSDVSGDASVAGIRLRQQPPGTENELPVRALFLFIGAVPHTEWVRGCIELDNEGFVLTGNALPQHSLESDDWRSLRRPPFFLETSIPGVFAAGDVRSTSVKRVASAVGEGSMAVSFVHAHLGALA